MAEKNGAQNAQEQPQAAGPSAATASETAFAALAEKKALAARNVLNAAAVAEFVAAIAQDRFAHMPADRRDALSGWMAGAARKWLLRDGAARAARQSDVMAAGSPPWATEAFKAKEELWVVDLGAKVRAQVGHVADWMAAEAPERQLGKLSFLDAVRKTVAWDAARERQAEKAGPDEPDDPQGVVEMGGAPSSRIPGARWVRVESAAALDREGRMMRHCVGSFADRVAEGSCQVYSLRDAQNKPLATVEVRPVEHEALRALAKAQGWAERRLQAALALPAAMEVAQARGPSNAPLSEAAALAIGDLSAALAAAGEPAWVAMADVGEGGLVPHPIEPRFVRWQDIEPGSKMPGRCVWAPTMGELPEGLEFETLEIRQIDKASKLPRKLKAASLAVGPSVRALDASGWDLKNVWLQRSGPFVKRQMAELKFGALEEIALEPAEIIEDEKKRKRLSPELVDPATATPFDRLEATAKRALLSGLRAKTVELGGVQTLDLDGAWLGRARARMADGAHGRLQGMRASFFEATAQAAAEGAEEPKAASWASLEFEELFGLNEIGQAMLLGQRKAARGAGPAMDEFSPRMPQEATRWRPDAGRAFEEPPKSKEVNRALKNASSENRKWSGVSPGLAATLEEAMDVAPESAAEATVENALGEPLAAIDVIADLGVVTPALCERLVSAELAIYIAPAVREDLIRLTALPKPVGKEIPAQEEPRQLAKAWATKEALSRAFNPGDEAARARCVSIFRETADDAAAAQNAKAREQALKSGNELDRLLPFSETGEALREAEAAGPALRDERAETAASEASAPEMALALAMAAKKWDRAAPLGVLLPAALQAMGHRQTISPKGIAALAQSDGPLLARRVFGHVRDSFGVDEATPAEELPKRIEEAMAVERTERLAEVVSRRGTATNFIGRQARKEPVAHDDAWSLWFDEMHAKAQAADEASQSASAAAELSGAVWPAGLGLAETMARAEGVLAAKGGHKIQRTLAIGAMADSMARTTQAGQSSEETWGTALAPIMAACARGDNEALRDLVRALREKAEACGLPNERVGLDKWGRLNMEMGMLIPWLNRSMTDESLIRFHERCSDLRSRMIDAVGLANLTKVEGPKGPGAGR
jgi:hypothetical protein